MNYSKILFLLFIFLFVILSFTQVNPAEDAVILYEYSKSLANSGLITYGNADVPIEGATDFLWMILIAGLSFLGFDEFLASLLLTGTALYLLFKILSEEGNSLLLILISLLTTPFIYAASVGFSPVFFSAIYVLCIKLFMKDESKKLYLAILLLCLIRPDGVVWGAPLVIASILQGGPTLEKGKSLFIYLIVPGLLYFVSRWIYFGELLPLPFYVKSAGERNFLIFILGSSKYVFLVGLPLIIIAMFSKQRKLIFGLMFLPIIFYCSMSLSQNIGNRFLAPMFFGGLYLLSKDKDIYKYAYVVFVTILSIIVTGSTVKSIINSKNENVFLVAKSLEGIDGSMLITEAGRLAYYSNWKVHDSWGLNTPEFSKRLIQPQDILQGDYDLIVAHCSLEDMKPLGPNRLTRTWGNQCDNIKIAVQNKYDTLLVPFYETNDNSSILYKLLGRWINQDKPCQRFDAYFIKKDSDIYWDTKSRLLSNGAITFNKEKLNVRGDSLCEFKPKK